MAAEGRASKERRGEDDGSGGEVGWRRAGTRRLQSPPLALPAARRKVYNKYCTLTSANLELIDLCNRMYCS
jgi:hypothetical protein